MGQDEPFAGQEWYDDLNPEQRAEVDAAANAAIAQRVAEQVGALNRNRLMGFHQLQGEIAQWGNKTFPQSTPQSIALHALREAVSLVVAVHVSEYYGGIVPDKVDADALPANLYNLVSAQVDHAIDKATTPTGIAFANPVEEAADVVLLLMHLCGRFGASLAGAANDKHSRNVKRAWGKPDEYGVTEHE